MVHEQRAHAAHERAEFQHAMHGGGGHLWDRGHHHHHGHHSHAGGNVYVMPGSGLPIVGAVPMAVPMVQPMAVPVMQPMAVPMMQPMAYPQQQQQYPQQYPQQQQQMISNGGMGGMGGPSAPGGMWTPPAAQGPMMPVPSGMNAGPQPYYPQQPGYPGMGGM